MAFKKTLIHQPASITRHFRAAARSRLEDNDKYKKGTFFKYENVQRTSETLGRQPENEFSGLKSLSLFFPPFNNILQYSLLCSMKKADMASRNIAVKKQYALEFSFFPSFLTVLTLKGLKINIDPQRTPRIIENAFRISIGKLSMVILTV